MAGSQETKLFSTQFLIFSVVTPALTAKRLLQKKDGSPGVENCYHQRTLEYAKDDSGVTHL